MLKTTLENFRLYTKTWTSFASVYLDKIANCSQNTSSNSTKLCSHQYKTCIYWFQWLFGLFRMFLRHLSWWQFGFRCPIFPGLLVLVSFLWIPVNFVGFRPFRWIPVDSAEAWIPGFSPTLYRAALFGIIRHCSGFKPPPGGRDQALPLQKIMPVCLEIHRKSCEFCKFSNSYLLSLLHVSYTL